ncbi:MAG: YceI family protein [Acidimicrobiales bacterium]
MTDPSSASDDLVAPEDAPRRRRGLRYGLLGGAVVLAGAAGTYTWTQVKPVVESRKYAKVTYEVPEAAQLTAQPGETVYRIDPTASSLTYEIDEEFAGRDTSTATGVTNGIAGDIALNADDLSKSRIEEVVANVEQFHSDNNLRDARLRQDFLESNRYPLITVTDVELDGLEGELVAGEEHDFTLTAAVKVKSETVKTTFDATATLTDDGALEATATAQAKLSRFGVGPIRIAGLVSTSDDVTLTLELTAYDPTERTIPTTITGPDAKEPTDAPSFAETVQPILEANCVSCHAKGEMGSTHVRLDTAGDARAVSQGLKTVTELRYMPPWPASDEGVPLLHEMRLTDDEIAAIGAWADAGGALDVDAATKLEATEDAQGPAPRQDVVLEREPYLGSVDNTNDYRCFVLDPGFTEPTYMTGTTFLPGGEVTQLHHAQLFHISVEEKEYAESVDGQDGQPGWECYSSPMLRGRGPQRVGSQERDAGFAGQSNLVGGWVPGQAPAVFPMDSGVLLQPGEALVLQMHYHFTGEVTPDASTIALQTEPGDSDIKALRVVNPLGPVEIPCAPEDQDEPLCDRDAAIADNVRLYGPSGASNESGLLMLCGQTPEALTAGFDGRRASTTCDHVVPEDGTIVAVLGHMHTLGSSFRLTLDPGEADEQVLLDIPRWSFDWQMNYGLADPIHVERGQPLELECSWDRDADPTRAPKYIVFAEGTEDEMCFATYALIPDEQG